MNHRTLIWITLGISFSLVFLVVLFYVINFHKFPISKDAQTWGTFGDYFGGILNPLIGIVNLLVLIYITFQIAHLETSRAESELTIQKQIALYSLKHDALKELNKILEQVQQELILSESNSELKIILLRNDFNAFINTNSYLFPFFDEMTWKPLRDSMEALSDIAGRYFKSGHSLNVDNDIIPELQKFNDLKIDFVNEVQSKILE